MGVGTIFLELKQPDRESDNHLPLQRCKLMRGNVPLSHAFLSWELSTGTTWPLHHSLFPTDVLTPRIWIPKSRICCCVVWILLVIYTYIHTGWMSKCGFLSAFAKFWEATISFVISICLSVCPSARPSVRMEELGSHWTDFHEIWYLIILQKSVEIFKFY